MNQQYHPCQGSHHNPVRSHHNPDQDWLPYFHNQPRNMQVNLPAPEARNAISDQFAINQSSAAPHNSIAQFGTLSYYSLFRSQPIVPQTINTQATGAPASQGPLSFAEMIQLSSTRIYGKKQFYAILDPIQEKYLGGRAKHWGITESEEPLSQETFQKIVDRLARPGRSEGGLRLQNKAITQAPPTSSEPEKTEVENHTPWTMLCLLYTSPSPRDRQKSRMPSSA